MDFSLLCESGPSVFAAELRPPRAELAAAEGMDAWIDTYHAVRRLTRQGTFVFLTDSAVGEPEEDNLRHLVTNLGHDVPRDRIVPFLTSSTRSSTACRTRSAPSRADSRRWSCSAATRASARRGRSRTRGSCGSCFARATSTLRSAAGRIRMRMPSGRSIF